MLYALSALLMSFTTSTTNQFEALMQEDLDIDELTQHAAKVITETAEEVLGKIPKKAMKKWISDETMQLIERDNWKINKNDQLSTVI